MVKCTDTGMVYAMQAAARYDVPDEENDLCGDCDWWEDEEQCPCGCGYACCDYKGELRHFEADACRHFVPRGGDGHEA